MFAEIKVMIRKNSLYWKAALNENGTWDITCPKLEKDIEGVIASPGDQIEPAGYPSTFEFVRDIKTGMTYFFLVKDLRYI